MKSQADQGALNRAINAILTNPDPLWLCKSEEDRMAVELRGARTAKWEANISTPEDVVLLPGPGIDEKLQAEALAIRLRTTAVRVRVVNLLGTDQAATLLASPEFGLEQLLCGADCWEGIPPEPDSQEDDEAAEPVASKDGPRSEGAPNPKAGTTVAVQQSQATKLVKMLRDVEFFHTPDAKAYATVNANGHFETHPVRSRGFKAYLNWRYYNTTRHALSGKALFDALGILEGMAIHEGAQGNVFCRVGSTPHAVYIDLGNERWEAIEVTADGWRIEPNPPVRFRRTRGMMALPRPERGKERGDDLFERLLNAEKYNGHKKTDDRSMIIGWLLGAMNPRGPYPVLILNSEQGSGKSTVAKLLRSLIDPNEAPMRSQPKDERDLMIAANNSWIINLDNVSHIPDWLSDSVCRISTGAGFGTRELHTDEDEALFSVCRPVILNGIEEIATRGDLMERSIVVELPAIPEDKRKPEKQFWDEFEAFRPCIMTYFLDGVVGALAHLPTTRLTRSPRMADFATWVTAAEASGALGWGEGHFLDIYESNRLEANDLTLDASPIARLLLSDTFGLLRGETTFTPAELLKKLSDHATDVEKKLPGWPKNARSLSSSLRRLKPALRASGVTVEAGRKAGGNRERIITLCRRAV